MTTTRWKTRPEHAPREVRGPWEGINYFCSTSLQARVMVDGKRKTKTFRYADYKGDVLAAHRAACIWRAHQLKNKTFKVRSQGPKVTTRRRRADGVLEHRIIVPCQTPDGVPTRVTFYVGTENTATRERWRKTRARAMDFWRRYKAWYERGGRHPMQKGKR